MTTTALTPPDEAGSSPDRPRRPPTHAPHGPAHALITATAMGSDGDPAPAHRGHDPHRAGPRARRRDPGQPGQPRPVSGHDVGGLVMPPGMIMTADTPADAMRDMAAVDPHAVTTEAPAAARGDQPLAPRIENGVKVFDLTVAVIGWHILPDRRVEAYAVNGQVPGPRLRVTQGDRVRVNVTQQPARSRPASTGTA